MQSTCTPSELVKDYRHIKLFPNLVVGKLVQTANWQKTSYSKISTKLQTSCKDTPSTVIRSTWCLNGQMSTTEWLWVCKTLSLEAWLLKKLLLVLISIWSVTKRFQSIQKTSSTSTKSSKKHESKYLHSSTNKVKQRVCSQWANLTAARQICHNCSDCI